MKNKVGLKDFIRKNMKAVIAIAVVIIAVVAAVIVLVVYEQGLVYKVCRVEAGVSIDVAEFLKKNDEKAYIDGYGKTIDADIPGEYVINVKTGLFKHKSKLIVMDTIAPELEVQDMTAGYGESIEAERFVSRLSDATQVTVSYAKEPDFKKYGMQTVTICATDMGGNTTQKSAQLMVWPVKNKMTLEAGSEKPGIADFLLDENIGSAEFVTDMEQVSMNHVADYAIDIQVGDEVYSVVLSVVDTKAPVISVKDIEGYAIIKREASQFVTECEDETDVIFTYESEPDLKLIGTQKLVIIATDEAGNTANAEVSLTLNEDTEPPVIIGAEDMQVHIGNTISYRSVVKAEDNCPEELNFVIDSSSVNVNVVGDYIVKCTATDAAGNSTEASFTVKVREEQYTVEEVYSYADAALSTIITDGMSQRDKAYAIFWYVRRHLSYYDYSDKSSWVKAAGEAFTKGRGDCFTYASMAKVLLTRAGITNMDIERIPSGNELHYWSIVDIGDGHGWYHFDTTPRLPERPEFFLWTDAQMQEYSAGHYNCFNYDRSAYPEIP